MLSILYTIRLNPARFPKMSDPCKPQACAIQDCLMSNTYNEAKCTQVIDKLYECCTAFYQEKGEDARSPCCPIPRLLKFKVEQRIKESVDAELYVKKR